MAILHARYVTTKQSCSFLNVSLGEVFLLPDVPNTVANNHFFAREDNRT